MRHITLDILVQLTGCDRDLILRLQSEALIEESADGYSLRDIDRVLAAKTLVRDLGIDPSALDLILRLRQELAEARSELRLLRGTRKS